MSLLRIDGTITICVRVVRVRIGSEKSFLNIGQPVAVAIHLAFAGATNLALAAPFSTIATNIPGQAGTTTFKDTSAAGAGPFFYWVYVP